MSRRRRKKDKLGLTGDQRLLVALHEVAKSTDDGSVRETAFSLIRWFQRGSEWSYPQKELARRLVGGHERTSFVRKTEKPRPIYSLYAVRIGAQLKIGHSSNLKSRLSSYRVGTSDVELLATIDLGQCSRLHAKNQERRLHKKLKHFRLEREIFSLDALADFKTWEPAVELLPVKRLPRRYESINEGVNGDDSRIG